MTQRRTSSIAILVVFLWACVAAASAQGTKNTSPVARFDAFLSSGGRGATVEFDGTGSSDVDGHIVSYQWVFGDGTTGSGAVREHAYPRPDSYTVILLVIDDAGGTGMITRTIDVDALSPRKRVASSSPAAGSSASSVAIGNQVGQRAPEFALPGDNDSIVRLSDYLGQLVVLEFWMSACPGCQASMSHLETLRVRYEAQGLVVVLVSIDSTAAGASEFLKKAGYLDFVSTLDIYWPMRPTRAAYGVGEVPHTFLIDRTGVIRYSGSPGGLTPAVVEAWI